MSEYSDYKMVEGKLREGMVQGTMHLCLRDVGRIAGGLLASGRLSSAEIESLGSLAQSLSINKKEGLEKWNEAVEYGRKQPLSREMMRPQDAGHAIGWDEAVNFDDYRIVDEKWLEQETIDNQSDDTWNPCAQLREYLTLLFKPDEHICYCTDPIEKNGHFIPSRGTCNKTVGEILKYLKKNNDTGFSEAVGTPNPACGAWIVINPIDGEGRKDENITDFRYALIECDEKPVEEQVAIYRKLELPCACIVHSGGKSAHAIVKINAPSIEEYRNRVNFIFEVCKKNGLPLDIQNRNPSRFSRMPGVERNGNKQFIIDRNCGKASWEEWETWIKDLNDNLPDFEPLTAEEVENPPVLAPELIEGILRVNHKMIVTGPSKAGKSFLLIELAIAIAEGVEWIGHKCMHGRVLYINMELDRRSCTRRFSDVYKALKIKPSHCDFIDRWNLRGYSMPLDKLDTKLVRRAKDGGYTAIILDPIYKVLTGDENNAADMSEFTRHLDHIAHECGCALIFCHHHSKGDQGGKRSMDRASGSGVFARDPDAMIDLLPLETENAKEQFMQSYECEAMMKVADEQDYTNDWRMKVSEDDKLVPNRLSGALEQIFDEDQMNAVRAAREAVKKEFDSVSGWRIGFTLREFASPSPQNLWFKHPFHIFDDDGILKECSPQGDIVQGSNRKKASKKQSVDKVSAFKQIIECDPKVTWTLSKAQEQFGVGKRTIQRYLKQLGWTVKHGVIVPEEEAKDDIPF